MGQSYTIDDKHWANFPDISFFRLPDGSIDGAFYYDANGVETADPEKVARKSPVSINQYREAATAEDFELVYAREKGKAGISDNQVIKEFLSKKLKEEVARINSLPASQSISFLPFIETVRRFEEWMESTGKSDEEIPKDLKKPYEYINEDFHHALWDYERKLSSEIEKWKSGKDVTGCAIFCLILKEKKYFIPNEKKTANLFTMSRYGLRTEVMLRGEAKIPNFKARMDKMKRLLSGTMFGKVS